MASTGTISSRDALTSRVIPQMRLRNPSIPTSSSKPSEASKSGASDPARSRFSIHGNAAVTGGAGNIALAASRALLEHGLSGLMILDLPSSLESSEVAIDLLAQDFPNAKIMKNPLDVSDEKQVDDAFAIAQGVLGSIDILLCFAGVVDTNHALEVSAATFRKLLDINTTGSFLCAQAAAKLMVSQKTGGSILFTASISAHRVNFPQPQVAYNTSKAALLMMKNCLAAEWAQYGIRVNSISPGYMDTILNEGEGLAECRSIWYSRTPMGRMGDPEELCGTIVMLCSGAGSYTTGVDIIVDGGSTLF